jgi:hypothetical protein
MKKVVSGVRELMAQNGVGGWLGGVMFCDVSLSQNFDPFFSLADGGEANEKTGTRRTFECAEWEGYHWLGEGWTYRIEIERERLNTDSN